MNQPANSHHLQAFIGYSALILTAILWGSAFIFQKNASNDMHAFTFNFLRFGIAAITLPVMLMLPNKLFGSQTSSNTNKITHQTWFIGLIAGVFMFFGISLQQYGLSYTSVGKSGFLTSLYIVIVPLLGFFIGQKIHLNIWLGAILSVFGIYLLNGGGLISTFDHSSSDETLNKGDLLTLMSAFFWGGQVLWLGLFAKYGNVIRIAIYQMVTVCLLSLVAIVFTWITTSSTDSSFTINLIPSFDLLIQFKWELAYTGIVSAALAFTLQIYGQQFISPTNAALIMSTEAIFALLGGVIILNEIVTPTMLIGCLTIFGGIILAQLPNKK